MKKSLLSLFCLLSFSLFCSAEYVSKVWHGDLGNGKYKNPIIYADYSDPDVCVGSDGYYMTASSFNCVPGLPILFSKDLVNWKLIGHAVQKLVPEKVFNKVQPGNGVWAPSIRFHNNEYYIYWGDPDHGIYMVKTSDPRSSWSDPVLVKKGKGLIDTCPLWDKDGKVYLSFALAGSRAALKSVLCMTELNSEGTKAIGEAKIIYDGHKDNPTIEGTKMYKYKNKYYIFSPAGGVPYGWQEVLRADSPWGPWEAKTVMAQGKTKINGPHQGAWIHTEYGEDWFINFQDVGVVGRIVHLNPMKWLKNGWPVIGLDPDGDGVGEPVSEYKKPITDKVYPVETPVENDDFNNVNLGLQWQWPANGNFKYYFIDAKDGILRLFSHYTSSYSEDTGKKGNLWLVPNLLLQKMPAPDFTATAKVKFIPEERALKEKAGLVLMGKSYSAIVIERSGDGYVLKQNVCKRADKGRAEQTLASVNIKKPEVYLRIKVKGGNKCRLYYSTNGKFYKSLGSESEVLEGQWIGAKIGFFCTRGVKYKDGGHLDVYSFVID